MTHRSTYETEVDRDARVVTSGFVHELFALSLGRLQQVTLTGTCPDPDTLFAQIDAVTRKFRNIHHRLNQARSNPREPVPAVLAIPPEVQAFAHHGEYLGAFPDVETFAHTCIDPKDPSTWAEFIELAPTGLKLHLGGRYWTVEVGGMTHAFATPEPPDSPPPASPEIVPGGGTAPAAASVPHHIDRAVATLRVAGWCVADIEQFVRRYHGRYPELPDYAAHRLRQAKIPEWLIDHADLRRMAEDWRAEGKILCVPDCREGVHVAVIVDPLAQVVAATP